MIIIDAGHGGFDPGGGSNALWKEKDLTLDISEYQFKRFKDLGIPVAMTRYRDENLSPKERVNRFNELSKKSKDAIGISNHINKDAGRLDGAEVYHSIKNNDKLSNLIAKELTRAGQNVRFVGTRQGQKGDYYFIIRDTQPTQTVLVEYGFADSPGNDLNLLLNNRYGLAEAVVKAVAEYKGYTYIPHVKGARDYVLYEIRRGDTLSIIAKKFKTTVEAIKKANDLKSDFIEHGTFLKIPLTFKLEGYKVRKGDTLFTIAKKYGTTPELIIALNQIPQEALEVGQIILVPSK